MLILSIHSWGKMSTGLETWDQSPKYYQHQGLRTGEVLSTVLDFAHLSSQTSQKHRTGIWGWQTVNTSNSLTKHGARCQPHTPTLITLLGKENRLHTSSFWRNRGCEERHPPLLPGFPMGVLLLCSPYPHNPGRRAGTLHALPKGELLKVPGWGQRRSSAILEGCPTEVSPWRSLCCQEAF